MALGEVSAALALTWFSENQASATGAMMPEHQLHRASASAHSTTGLLTGHCTVLLLRKTCPAVRNASVHNILPCLRPPQLLRSPVASAGSAISQRLTFEEVVSRIPNFRHVFHWRRVGATASTGTSSGAAGEPTHAWLQDLAILKSALLTRHCRRKPSFTHTHNSPQRPTSPRNLQKTSCGQKRAYKNYLRREKHSLGSCRGYSIPNRPPPL